MSFRVHAYLYASGKWVGAELHIVKPADDLASTLAQLSNISGGKLQHITLLFDHTLVRDIKGLRENDHIVVSDVPSNQITTPPPHSPGVHDLLAKIFSQLGSSSNTSDTKGEGAKGAAAQESGSYYSK